MGHLRRYERNIVDGEKAVGRIEVYIKLDVDIGVTDTRLARRDRVGQRMKVLLAEQVAGGACCSRIDGLGTGVTQNSAVHAVREASVDVIGLRTDPIVRHGLVCGHLSSQRVNAQRKVPQGI